MKPQARSTPCGFCFVEKQHDCRQPDQPQTRFVRAPHPDQGRLGNSRRSLRGPDRREWRGQIVAAETDRGRTHARWRIDHPREGPDHRLPAAGPGARSRRTALEEALSASTELHALEEDLHKIEHQAGRPGGLWQRPKRWTRALETQQRLLERYEELGGAELREARARHAARAGPGRSGFQQQGRRISAAGKRNSWGWRNC